MPETADIPVASQPPATQSDQPVFSGFDAGLYALTVFAWGTSWVAMKYQVDGVAPEVSLVYRFALAAGAMLIWALLRRMSLRFSWQTHLRFLALGILLFSSNFFLFYHGAKVLPSGLLSVVFSLASIVNLVLGVLLLGQKATMRLVIGGLLGAGGIVCLFWPQIVGTQINAEALVAFGLCVGGTFCFCLGNMVTASNLKQKIPLVLATFWGMVYGTAFMALIGLINGAEFRVDWTMEYSVSLVYLALVASVLAFAAYLTLLGRIGAARAGYATVMFPIVALAISTVFEGYQWTLIAAIGVTMAAAGNIIVLQRR